MPHPTPTGWGQFNKPEPTNLPASVCGEGTCPPGVGGPGRHQPVGLSICSAPRIARTTRQHPGPCWHPTTPVSAQATPFGTQATPVNKRLGVWSLGNGG